MTPERWQQIRDVLEKALELVPGERSAFLNQACSSDPSLRQEVETLLASSPDVRSGFLESSTLRVTLTLGTKLGDYEVKSLLGSGGMGEVYRARDSRLGRDVAIKVLPSLLSADSERLRRFEQEARAAAALNHPNILAVFQMGTFEGAPYLVSELLEGETLREPIRQGRLPVRKAIDYGVQIARGLAAAHEKGIVHRDLKPENLFVTKDGRVKILDFGLAKLTQPQSSSAHSAVTLTEGTEAGVVMGTVGYMSPEQVRGQTADHRADIFAFGAILYEMLAGKRAFQKPTSPETMTAILNEDAGISQVTTYIPQALQRVVHRCLEKNPEQRFQSASDLAFALDALSESGGPAYSAMAAKAATDAGKRWKVIVPAALVVLAFLVGAYFYFHSRPKLTDKDTIVLAEFANSTGDAIFDDTLKTALNVSLRQSPFLNVLSDSEVAKTLQLMTRPADTKLTPAVTRELCQRAGSKVYIAGSIGSLGSEYVLGLKAVNCKSGDTLAEEQVTAASKEKVLDALGEAASKLRGELGESLASVQKFDVPLQQATTASLEALKKYSAGKQAFEKGDVQASIAFIRRAVDLDPNFARAYAALSANGDPSLARQYALRAYELRDRVTEPEKLRIEGAYYDVVTGELEKANQTYALYAETYPRDSAATDNLAYSYWKLGQHEKCLTVSLDTIRFSPGATYAYGRTMTCYVALNRLDEAKTIYKQALAQADSSMVHQLRYRIAFLENDAAEMDRQVLWAAGKPGAEQWFLESQAETEQFFGRMEGAQKLFGRVVESALRNGDKTFATAVAIGLAGAEADLGNFGRSRQQAAAVLSEARDPDNRISVAIVLARAGDPDRAEKIGHELEKEYALNTMIGYGLRTNSAAIEINRKQPAKALEFLQATSPYEYSGWWDLYAVYIRGLANLQLRHGKEAAADFQEILDHRGIVGRSLHGALAHLGLARARLLSGDTAGAKAAYQDFLTLWKDADPDIPILKEAKAEYAKLQ
jgi:serine/threonine protein kinase/Flp pilus assembly protein TadD